MWWRHSRSSTSDLETQPSSIDHLRLKTAIRMTIAQKFEYKTNGYNMPWDPTTSITAYFTQLDRFQVSLGDRGIATSDQKKQWQRALKCGSPKCLLKIKWSLGKTGRQQRRHGRRSRHTSLKSGWSESIILPPRQSNRNSSKRRSKLKRQQQRKRKARHRQCYSRC